MLGWIRVNQGKKRATFYVVVPWDRLDGSGQRKNWQFKYDRNGDRFESEAHAHRHLEYLRALIDDKAFNPFDWVEEKPHSFQNLQGTYFRACLSIVKRDEMSPSTLKTKRRYWKLYFLPFFSGMDIKHIRNIHLRQFHDQLPATLKAKTRLNVVSDVEGFLRWCKEEEILKGAVPHYTGMKDLRKKAQKERPKPRKSTHMMGGDDFSKTLDQMSPSDRPIFEFLRITGCRQSEARALQRQDIDWTSRIIEIRRTFVDSEKGEVIIDRAKSDSNHPTYLTPYLEHIIKSVPPRLDHPFVFWNKKTGKPYTRREIDYRWRTAQKKAGLPHLQLKNATRGHAVCELLELGYSYAEAGAFVGHKNESTTRHYGQIFTESLERMAGRQPKATTKLQPKPKKGKITY
jgi:integrase